MCLIVCLSGIFSGNAQNYTVGKSEDYCDWEEFVNTYTEEVTTGSEGEEDVASLLEQLEQMHAAPLNINSATREELLQIPFLRAEQADSLIAYRQKKHYLLSLGELQLISTFAYEDRRRLSLFVYAGDTLRPPLSLRQRIFAGSNELSTLLGIPFYQRAGYRHYSDEILAKYPNRVYHGNALSHTLRFRHQRGEALAYGITLQKDAGEPFAKEGNYPYDYLSAYTYFTTRGGREQYWLGDYNLHCGQGLLIAGNAFKSRSSLIEQDATARKVVTPHTSTTESGFMRGAAVMLTRHHARLTLFASCQPVDGNLKNDTLVTLYTDGLHRTTAELQHRRAATLWTAGGHWEYRKQRGGIGASLLYDRYRYTVWPTLRTYNRYYLRGKTAAGGSIDYYLRRRRMSMQGEAALDKGLHPALLHTVRYALRRSASATVQVRHFSSRYVAPHANALSQNARIQNETGLLMGLSLRPTQRWVLASYLDLFYHRRPIYRASRNDNKGMELWVKATVTCSPKVSLQLSHKWKSRQQDITGYAGTLQYVTTHRSRLSSTYRPGAHFSIYAAADMALSLTQTSAMTKGWMLSTRISTAPSSHLTIAWFSALFFTDDYATRLYAYEPQMRYSCAFPSFAYHGVKTSGVITYKILHNTLHLSMRYSGCHYFNRSSISSGTQLIDSASQNDGALQLLWKF